MRLKGKSARALALGSQGDAVVDLQNRLISLGYDPGPLDGQFGYLTQDAVTAFQRDNGLRVDGIAGPRVRGLAKEPAMPGRRQTLVLGAGEDLASAAARLGVNLEALKHMNHLAPGARGYPGQRLVYRTHYVAGALTTADRRWRDTYKAIAQLSAVSVPIAVVAEGHLQFQAPSATLLEDAQRAHMPLWLTVAPIGRTAATVGQQVDVSLLLSRAKSRRTAVEDLIELSRTHKSGVWLDLGRPHWGDGPKLLAFVHALHEGLTRNGWPLMVTLPLPEGNTRWRWWLTDIDYATLSRIADKVVLGAHIPGGMDSFAMYCRRIEALLDMTPPWKALLGIGLRAEVRNAQGDLLGELGYPSAVTTAYLAKVRPKWDPVRKLLRAAIPASPEEQVDGHRNQDPFATTDRVLWLPGRDAVDERLALVHRYTLAGVVFQSLGDEDVRVWDIIPKRIVPEHMLVSKSGT